MKLLQKRSVLVGGLVVLAGWIAIVLWHFPWAVDSSTNRENEQRAFYATHAPEGIALDDLAMLGPIFVLKFRFEPEDLGRRLVAEAWFYPDGSRILELSTKCGTSEAFQVAAEARAFLAGRGIEVSGEQQTKTRKALDYFSEALKA